MKKRILSMLLAIVMVVGMLPTVAFAAAGDNLYDHHTAHTAECGYMEGVSDCAYHCDECLGHTHDQAAHFEAAEECSCESDDSDWHAPFCEAYVAPEDPECLCVEVCGDFVNEYCDVCYFDAAACWASGEEEAELFALSKDSNGNYLIEDADDLRAFAALVNGGTAPANAVLTQNINLGNQSWTPIGSLAHPYSGHFDGQGYTISGLNIDGEFTNDPAKTNGLNPGLFGNIQGAGIRNLTVSGSNTATVLADNTLSTPVGSALLVGHMSDAIVYNCYAKGSAKGAGPYYGGLAGIAQHSIIINCGSEADVQGTGTTFVGGLVGVMTAGYDAPLCLLNSWCTGNVTASTGGTAGGLVGYLADDAVNNYYSGTLTVQGPNIGQLFGYVANGIKATPDAASTTTFAPVIEKNYYKSGSGDAIGTATEGLNATGFGETYSDLNTLRRTMNSNLPEVEKIIDGHRGYLSTTQWAELVSLLNGEDVKAFHWQNGDSSLYLQEQHVCNTEGICECGNGYDPDAVAVLSKNGKHVFAGTTLDAVITEAEKCAAGDKAVVTILKNIDLGTSNYQSIDSGVFTIDLNGYKISYNHVNYSTLRINNSGTDITLISSRPGGTVENRRYNGRAIMTGRNTNLTATGISVITGNEGYAIYLNGNATLSDVTVQVSEDGIHIQNTAKEHDVTLICTNCTVQATELALFISDDCTATITGGSLTGGREDITAVGSATVAGTAFPGGIKITNYHSLNEILADGYAYWAGDTMLSVADNALAITDKGDITVKAACTHEWGEKNYVNNGEDHTYTWSCCKLEVTEDHTFTNIKCVCGANLCDHSGNKNKHTDCTEALMCSVCGDVLTEAAASHTPGADDGDCTTAVKCVNCDQITTAAKDAHTPGEDDNDCTTAVKCTNCDQVVTAAKDHIPAEDDGDCTTAVKCVYCDKNAVEAKDRHAYVDGICADCGEVCNHSFENGTCVNCGVTGKPLVITKQPETAKTELGEKFIITVEVEGDGLTYQWYYKDKGMADFAKSVVKKATYSFEMVNFRVGREYYCVIIDQYGNSVRTNTVKSTTDTKIVTQPQSVEVENGQKVSISVSAVGEGLKYQWYYKNKNGKEFAPSSYKGKTYSVNMSESNHGRQVYCVITDIYGNTFTTEAATMTRPPVALEIVTQPQDVVVANGKTANITVEAKGDGLQYQWYYKNRTGTAFAASSYKGKTYSVGMSNSNHYRQVYCVITDQYGNSVTTRTATMSHPPVELKITSQPQDGYAAMGDKFLITIEAQGDGLKYQWYYKDPRMKDFGVSAVKKASYSFEMVNFRNGRLYYCVITDMYGNSVTTDTIGSYVADSGSLALMAVD